MAHVQDDQAYEILTPLVESAIQRAPLKRFSTKGFIDFLRSVPEGEQGYQAAIGAILDEAGSDHMARMIIHGQVVPSLLRRSPLLRFGGFVHGNPAEDDGYAVPSWWRKV